jgi:hypothetical protein
VPLSLGDAIDVILAHAGEARHAPRVRVLRADFEKRTGTFTPEDPWFDARSGAFWDDALTTHAFGRDVASLLADGARFWVEPLARAHRGLFRARRDKDMHGPLGFHLVDAWSGAEFRVQAAQGLRDALDQAEGFFDGRVAGAFEDGRALLGLLPGAVFHAEDATDPIGELIDVARARHLERGAFLDALLRMDHTFRGHSRVKAAFAYRKEALR